MVAPVSNPVIPVDDVKVHILLMMSINKLQEYVERGPIPVDHQSGDLLLCQETLTYIQTAVHRFCLWLDYLTTSPSVDLDDEPVPPLDVLMVWHAYMLSPGVYYQDADREFPALKTLGGMPWNKIALCVRENASFFSPSAGQIQEWEKTTALPSGVPHLPLFSIDLVAAVLRQSQSLQDMISEIKRHEGALDEWISSAIIRYSQFMRLPEEEYVPPIDVDIIWHTHQLAGAKYWDETLLFFGSHINHNDNITPQAARHGQKVMESFSHMLRPIDLDEEGEGYTTGRPGAKCTKGGGGGSGGITCNGPRGQCLRNPPPPPPRP